MSLLTTVKPTLTIYINFSRLLINWAANPVGTWHQNCGDNTRRRKVPYLRAKKHPRRGLTVFLWFFIASGVGLSPLYCGHFWPIVPAPDDGWGWLWSNWWNEDWQGKPKYSEETCPSATLSTTNPTWPDPGLNPGRRDGKFLWFNNSHSITAVWWMVEWIFHL
jgi:hypothetical protein